MKNGKAIIVISDDSSSAAEDEYDEVCPDSSEKSNSRWPALERKYSMKRIALL
jgi:hypothetical protein